MKTKYTLELNGTVTDGKYTQSFSEKNVTYIEFEFKFGNKKIEIGKKSLEKQITTLLQQLKTSMNQCERSLSLAETREKKLEKIKECIDKSGVSFSSTGNKIKEILEGKE